MKTWMRAYLATGKLQNEAQAGLENLPFVELKQLAKEKGIKFKASIKKAELIALLEEYAEHD